MVCGVDRNRGNLERHSGLQTTRVAQRATTLTWMRPLLVTMFIGPASWPICNQVQPHDNETVISQFARTIFTVHVWFYFVIQRNDSFVLILAATLHSLTFRAWPASWRADRFVPRQFATRGDNSCFQMGSSSLRFLPACS